MEEEMKNTIGTRDLLLLLLNAWSDDRRSGGSLGGITRLQKLLFLLEREEGLKPTGSGFQFEAYKAGPYSSKLYDDLEFLENLGMLRSEVTAESTEPEAAEVEKEEADVGSLSFDDLMGDGDAKGPLPDAFEERRFGLTDEGKRRVEELLAKTDYRPVVDGIRRIKSKYASHSLNDLLYHVYTKYPEMAVESEIKDQVLGRRSR
jgi:hypothetical protein